MNENLEDFGASFAAVSLLLRITLSLMGTYSVWVCE